MPDILQIRQYPDPVLKQKAARVASIDRTIRRLAEDMHHTMLAAEGVGLAAPQVGESLRLIVVDLGDRDGAVSVGTEPRGKEWLALVNPVVLEASGEVEGEEGCLSVPGFKAKVVRADKVTVGYQDLDGQDRLLAASGLLARVLQHEIDHLDGILFFDRLSRLKRELMVKRLRKRALKAG